jgi:hypothetical protein
MGAKNIVSANTFNNDLLKALEKAPPFHCHTFEGKWLGCCLVVM